MNLHSEVGKRSYVIWKEAVVMYFKVLFRHSPGSSEENHELSRSEQAVSRRRIVLGGLQHKHIALPLHEAAHPSRRHWQDVTREITHDNLVPQFTHWTQRNWRSSRNAEQAICKWQWIAFAFSGSGVWPYGFAKGLMHSLFTETIRYGPGFIQ